MPFGLSRAAISFQCLMNIIMRGLSFVSTYMDVVFVHSESEELHRVHLQEAFKQLRQAGLTLRGVKCQTGVSQMTNLALETECLLDDSKIQAVRECPKPINAGEVHQFLGLAIPALHKVLR